MFDIKGSDSPTIYQPEGFTYILKIVLAQPGRIALDSDRHQNLEGELRPFGVEVK